METQSDMRGRWVGHNFERQTRIVRAAIELLESSPSMDVPIQDIANRAGLSKSVVYRQFDGRDDLDRRIRAQIADDLLDTLIAALDFSQGSVSAIARRTIQAIGDWAEGHQRLYGFLRSGPSSDSKVSAIGTLKDEVADKISGVVNSIAMMIGEDPAPFRSLPYALVTMVEGTLTRWVQDPAPKRSRDEIIEDLALYVGYLIDGGARTMGVDLDQSEELMSVIARLAARDRSEP
ncbi:MAG: TetR/AcrR family transcriptional regulator [Nocardiaceae bacterium]|nr:TetR/AcrR family transcriptional regulator [Nocardiaceae bacterium]